MTKIFHVIGTDTDIGKTYAMCQLIKHCNQYGIRSNGLKPLATGTTSSNNFINNDAWLIAQANSDLKNYNTINPIHFKEPIAPHIAAAQANYHLNAYQINQAINNSISTIDSGNVFIEGVGGIMVPLNENETYLDLLRLHNQPIILIAAIKLGGLNHALLTTQVLLNHNLPLIGWIANFINPDMPYQIENFNYLQHKLPIPCLAVIDYQTEIIFTNRGKEIFLCN